MAMYGYGSEFGKEEDALTKMKRLGANFKSSATDAAGNVKAKLGAVTGKQALGATLKGAAPVIEGVNTLNDVTTPGMDNLQKFGRVSEGVLRTAGAVKGAAMGATAGSAVPIVGTTVGGIAGGTLGYFAPDLIVGGINKATDAGLKLPSDRAAELQASNAKQNNALAPKPQVEQPKADDNNPKALLPNESMATLPEQPLVENFAKFDDGTGKTIAGTGIAPTQGNYNNIDQQRAKLANTMLSGGASQGKTAFGSLKGYDPLSINADAQDLVRKALVNLDGIQNQANADTLGGALAQKIKNKQITEKSMAMARTADQLQNLANGSLGIRQGTQKLVQGDVAIDQDRQNLIKGDTDIQRGKQQLLGGDVAIDQAKQNLVKGGIDIAGGKQKTMMQQNELERSAQLKKTLTEYADPKTTPERRQVLADLALTLQGKEPANRFDVRANADGSSYVIDKKTGEMKPVSGTTGTATPPPTKSQRLQGPDGIFYEFDGTQWNPIK